MKRRIIIAVLGSVILYSSLSAKITYVNPGATGLNNGTSWANAFTALDSILNTVLSYDSVWVVNGTYYCRNSGGFKLDESTKLFGGFEGTETAISQRNWTTFKTILSGGISSTSPITTSTIVRFGRSAVSSSPYHCRLDGFKITGAVDHPPSPFSRFATAPIVVMQSASTNPSNFNGSTADIANCLITGNSGQMGGGVACLYTKWSGEVRITNCIFENNQAVIAGGAIFNGKTDGYGSYSYLQTGNTTDTGICRFIITDCSFRGNSAPVGGAIAAWDSTMTINRCTFSGNVASRQGGAIYDSLAAEINVYNSVFVGNKALNGAAHYTASPGIRYKKKSFTHCTFADNFNTEPTQPSYALTIRKTTDSILNCIFWNNSVNTSGAQLYVPAGSVVRNNLIQGKVISGTAASFNFNPLFVAPGSASAAPFPIASSYDYHLQANSPAIDSAINLGLAMPLDRDRDSLIRVFGPKPDLGAYERPYCSFHMTLNASGPTTFCLPNTVTLSAAPTAASKAFQYFWNANTVAANSVVASSSGSYKVIGIDSAGCRSTASVTVNAVPVPNPIISISGNTLSVPTVYATYQWYKAGVMIPGATAATYNPPTNGSYSVKVTTVNGGCSGTSTAFVLTNLEVNATSRHSSIKIYPNPVLNGLLTITCDRAGQVTNPELVITDLSGKQVYTTRLGQHSPWLIDLKSVAPGMYFVYFYSDEFREVAKIRIN